MQTPTERNSELEKRKMKGQNISLEEYKGVEIKKISTPEDILKMANIKVTETCECCHRSITSILYCTEEYEVDFALFKLSGGVTAEHIMWNTGYREADLFEVLTLLIMLGKPLGRIEVLGSRFRRHGYTYLPLILKNKTILACGESYQVRSSTYLPFVKRIGS